MRQPESRTALTGHRTPALAPGQPGHLAEARRAFGCGIVGMVAGAGASLLVPRADQLAVWCAVAAAVSVTSALTWDTRPVTACQRVVARWLAGSASS